MLDTILQFLGPVVGMLNSQFGQVGTIMAYLIAGIPIVSVVLELIEFVVALINDKAAEATAAKVQAVWDKIMPVLEVLPHANIPLSPVLMTVTQYVLKGAAALKGAIQGWMSGGQPPQS